MYKIIWRASPIWMILRSVSWTVWHEELSCAIFCVLGVARGRIQTTKAILQPWIALHLSYIIIYPIAYLHLMQYFHYIIWYSNVMIIRTEASTSLLVMWCSICIGVIKYRPLLVVSISTEHGPITAYTCISIM